MQTAADKPRSKERKPAEWVRGRSPPAKVPRTTSPQGSYSVFDHSCRACHAGSCFKHASDHQKQLIRRPHSAESRKPGNWIWSQKDRGWLWEWTKEAEAAKSDTAKQDQMGEHKQDQESDSSARHREWAKKNEFSDSDPDSGTDRKEDQAVAKDSAEAPQGPRQSSPAPTSPEPPVAKKVLKVSTAHRETADMVTRHLTLNETLNEGEGDLWQYVRRRVTIDRDTGEHISDDQMVGMSEKKLRRKLDNPRRLKMVFYLDGESDGSRRPWRSIAVQNTRSNPALLAEVL